MRKVISGKVYDTEKAILVAEDRYGYPGDFEAWHEALYKTAKGNYFLFGEGGALTKYSRSVGNGTTSGGSEIRPLTPAEAFDWLEAHGTAEVIEREFPDKVEEA